MEGTFGGMWPLASHSRLALDPATAQPRPPPRWWWGSLALAHFWEGDHLKDVPLEVDAATGRPLPLAERVRRLVQRETGARPEGRVCLLTHLRYLGYVFNPVSFYYVWDKEVGGWVKRAVGLGLGLWAGNWADAPSTPQQSVYVYLRAHSNSTQIKSTFTPMTDAGKGGGDGGGGGVQHALERDALLRAEPADQGRQGQGACVRGWVGVEWAPLLLQWQQQQPAAS